MANFGVTVLSASPLSAQDQYVAWATELGVSTTASLQVLTGDDLSWAITLDTGCLGSGNTYAEFSSEGLFGWSGATKLNQPVNYPFSRMYYQNGIEPDRFYAFRFEGYDCESVDVKLQKANGVTIIGGTIFRHSYTAPRDEIYFAIRFPNNSADYPQVVITRNSIGTLNAVVYVCIRDNPIVSIAPSTIPLSSTALIGVQYNDLYANTLTQPLGILRAASPEALTPTGPGTRAMTEPLGRHDPWFGGNGFVAGTTKNTPDTPVGRRVVLLDQRTRIAIRETWSDAVTGAYRFENLNRDARYTVISYDHTGSFKAVIADNLTAEVMP